MADQQLLDLLKKRVRTWNRWQRQHANAHPDLRNADLGGAHLSFAQLQRADLHGAKLYNTLLCNANLRYADLSGADLSYADLSHTDLSHADLTGANLSNARLHCTNLNGTTFRDSVLINTNLSHALLQHTTFANVDLSEVIGLDTVYHLSPSTIGLDTVSRSKRNIPEIFLRSMNIHENLLTSIREQGKTPFDYFTIFISYAGEDEVFAQRLHNDLRREGVWCWFAPYSLRGGDYFKARIDSAIKQCDKLLVIFSQHALASEWVRYEVELARQKERKRNTTVIVPICLDASVMNEPGWATFIGNKRHIRSFVGWERLHSYPEALKLLLRDLQMNV
ncbi:MAG TPA: toll/interleukin-1 receptor domain-containing protein [Ktedonobacteraceae bacterium]|nr:toll/interleukin-1 receptor domain-containing protein [Ktedonobacteraceae bacterium]